MLFKGFATTLATMLLSAPVWAFQHYGPPSSSHPSASYSYIPTSTFSTSNPISPECHTVPEISSAGSLAAIIAVAALAAILYERRRRA